MSVLMAFALVLTLLPVSAMADTTPYGIVKTTSGVEWASESITQDTTIGNVTIMYAVESIAYSKYKAAVKQVGVVTTSARIPACFYGFHVVALTDTCAVVTDKTRFLFGSKGSATMDNWAWANVKDGENCVDNWTDATLAAIGSKQYYLLSVTFRLL